MAKKDKSEIDNFLEDLENEAPSTPKTFNGRFAIGNQDWQKRKNIGRPKNIESPEILWELACEYFQYCDENPIKTIDYKGSQVEKVEYPHPMPYTWEGFSDYLFSKGVINHIENYRYNKGGDYSDFMGIIKTIGDIMHSQKFNGAAVGIFNANIIARELGLKERTENEHTGKDGKPLDLGSLSFEEKKLMLDLIDKTKNADK